MKKGLLEEKQRELIALAQSMQKECEQTALTVGKLMCPQSKFTNQITSVSMISADSMTWILWNNLQGGNHDQGELFSISSKTWKIWATFNQRMLNYPTYIPLWFKLGDESKQIIPRPLEIVFHETSNLPVELLEMEDSRESYLIRVTGFWAQLEMFLCMYMKHMQNCPEKLVNADLFFEIFCNAKIIRIMRRAAINNYKRKKDTILIYEKGTDAEKEVKEFFRSKILEELEQTNDDYYFTKQFEIPHWEESDEEYLRLCDIVEELIPVADLCRPQKGRNSFYIAIPSDKYVDEKIRQLSYAVEELEKWKRARIE